MNLSYSYVVFSSHGESALKNNKYFKGIFNNFDKDKRLLKQ